METVDDTKITLKAARVNAGLTQEEAAKSLEISVFTLLNYESGKSFPDVKVIKKIEKLYGIPYHRLNFLLQNYSLTVTLGGECMSEGVIEQLVAVIVGAVIAHVAIWIGWRKQE